MDWAESIKFLKIQRVSHRHADEGGQQNAASTIYGSPAQAGGIYGASAISHHDAMLLGATQLADVAFDPAAAERCGPGSGRPAIAFHLRDADPLLAARMASLPCPVIGIGDGETAPELAAACDVILPDERELDGIARNIHHAPYAAMVLVQHLRASASLPAEDALTAESLAFACLQAGSEFACWRRNRPPAFVPEIEPDPVMLVERCDDILSLVLNRPGQRNAINAALRDALCEALDLALVDPSIRTVTLTGQGRSFSEGGDVAEFGQMLNVVEAHRIRSLRLPARRLVTLADRLAVHVNGAAIGAGVEMAAFASRVTASPRAWFQLPELRYGLLPGAGGTVSIPRRIGRQRTAYMALTMRRVAAQQALEWGLIDEIV